MNPRRFADPELPLFIVGFSFFAVAMHMGARFGAGVAAGLVVVAGLLAGARGLGVIR